MSDDIVKRLRGGIIADGPWPEDIFTDETHDLMQEAADEIERLREAVRYLFTEEWPKGFDPGDLAAPDHVEAAIRRAMEGNQ